jgi:eukaryotic-like serine/threonine-protein kinase
MMIGRRYRTVERVASGGMGDVWLAEDAVLRRPVAIKLLKPEFAGNAEFRLRLRREARHVAGLSHPGIACMYDYGEDPQPYLVMEFVAGEPLSAVLSREGALSPRRTASIVAQTASALACAHARRIVHRDIKPDNLLVADDGVVKVTDFGIALAADGVAITQTGTFMGTPRYASPEQVVGRSATPSSDLYALGLVAYECLTGAPPFEGGAIALALAHRDRLLPALPDQVPQPLRRLVAALTAKDPGDRPEGAATVAAWAGQLAEDPEADVVPELHPSEVVTEDPQTPGTPPPTVPPGVAAEGPARGRRLRPLVWSGVAAAVLLAGGGGWLLRPSNPPPPVSSHLSPPRSTAPSPVTLPPVVRFTAAPARPADTTRKPTSTKAPLPVPPKQHPGKAKGHHKHKKK